MAGSVDSPHAADLDRLLESISDEGLSIFPDSWVPVSPPPSSTSTEEEKCDSPLGESGSSFDGGFSYVSELEKFLMEDEEEEDGVAVKEGSDADSFFVGLFAEGFRDCESEAHILDPEAIVDCKRREENEEAPAAKTMGSEDDNPVSKKLRRRMRNTDSGMKSGERKKIYVKELEKKSKYLESENWRLDYVLRCCAAENIALRQCLLKDKLFDAPANKQETGVLFVELASVRVGMEVSHSSTLPVIVRLDQVAHQLHCLEEKQSARRKHMAVSEQALQPELETKCRPLASVLEEVPRKGSLMDRVETLELRVVKLTMELEERERVQSSMLMSTANDGCWPSTRQEKDDIDSGFLQNDSQNACFDKQLEVPSVLKSTSKKKINRFFGYRKWLGWMHIGC